MAAFASALGLTCGPVPGTMCTVAPVASILAMTRPIVLIAVACATAGLTAAALSAPGSAEPTTTLHYLQQDVREQVVDTPPKHGNPSAGDTFYASNRLLDPTSKQRVGITYSACSIVVPGGDAAGSAPGC